MMKDEAETVCTKNCMDKKPCEPKTVQTQNRVDGADSKLCEDEMVKSWTGFEGTSEAVCVPCMDHMIRG